LKAAEVEANRGGIFGCIVVKIVNFAEVEHIGRGEKPPAAFLDRHLFRWAGHEDISTTEKAS